MINLDDIESGDKVYTRDGGCLVARLVASGNMMLGADSLNIWLTSGSFDAYGGEHPLDIIRIEKAPKLVVEEDALSDTDCLHCAHNKLRKMCLAFGLNPESILVTRDEIVEIMRRRV